MRQRRRHHRPGVSLVDDPSLHSAGLSLFTCSLSLLSFSFYEHLSRLSRSPSPSFSFAPPPPLPTPARSAIPLYLSPGTTRSFLPVPTRFQRCSTAIYSDYTFESVDAPTPRARRLEPQSPSRSYEKASARFTGAPRMLGSGLSVLEDRRSSS